MRIRQLGLAAFGPFTDRALTFEDKGLHVVYGPNEAGKSSALRALKALLYGIDERTLDNFIHANDKLRIHGVLQSADEHTVAFARRKGRKNTLLTPDGDSLDEQVLVPFLRGVTAELFETLFGIDHQALVRGGQEILEQKGEVGQALFSAALGSQTLHAVIAELDSAAKALFLPTGTKPVINAAIREHRELKAAIRQDALSSKAWDEHRRALERVTKELEHIRLELSDSRGEVNRLQRIQRILPKLSRRRELIQALEAMGEVVVLPDDFAGRRQQAQQGLKTAQAALDKALPRLAELQRQRAELSVNQPLLDQAERIEELHTRLGEYRKAQQDRPHLDTEYRQLMAGAESLLREIRPDLELSEIEILRSALSKRQRIAELGTTKAVLKSRMEKAEKDFCDTDHHLQAVRKERDGLPELPSPEALHQAIAAARKQGELDDAIRSARRDIQALRAECTQSLARLMLWRGELDDIPGLAVPGRETIQRFETDYDELAGRTRRLVEKQEAITESLRKDAAKLDEIERVGQIPTEAALYEMRTGRDSVWQALRRQWIEGEDVSVATADYQREASLADTPLPDIFERYLMGADEMSDRLRREADRVHEVASLRSRLENGNRDVAEITAQLAELEAEGARLDADWVALWTACRIEPATPREMRAWLEAFERLRDQVTRLHRLIREAEELECNRARHIQRLDAQLTAVDRAPSASEELESVLSACESVARHHDDVRRRRADLNKNVKERESAVERLDKERRLATEAFEQWRRQWADALQDIGLSREATPSEANDFIEHIRTLFSSLDAAAKLRIRIDAIDRDAGVFRGDVEAIIAAVAQELAGLVAADAVARLHGLLSDNRKRQTQRQQLNDQVGHATREIEDAQLSIQTMTAHLDALCVEAGCDVEAQRTASDVSADAPVRDHSQLEVAERHSTDYRRTRVAIDEVERTILEAGEGSTIAELEAQAREADPDSLPGRIAELKDRIEGELEPRGTQLAETKGRAKKELELMDGSDRVAALAEQAEATLAAIRADAERYIQVKLAGKILQDRIEQYRQENQGPLLRRASDHFAALTLNSFEGLITDFSERDEPILVGVRPEGEQVRVEGMSSGTRDQLYLALRLASLEKYMESSGPMPFIVDDILVDFDDARSQAALSALAELGGTTQVILFTHHTRVVEQARALQSSLTARVHEL